MNETKETIPQPSAANKTTRTPKPSSRAERRATARLDRKNLNIRLKNQYGEGTLVGFEERVNGQDIYCVFSRPERDDMSRMAKDAAASQDPHSATEAMCFDLLVHPPQAEFRELLERMPGLVFSLGDALFKKVGGKANFIESDL